VLFALFLPCVFNYPFYFACPLNCITLVWHSQLGYEADNSSGCIWVFGAARRTSGRLEGARWELVFLNFVGPAILNWTLVLALFHAGFPGLCLISRLALTLGLTVDFKVIICYCFICLFCLASTL
jgi:hypothetical protein